MRGFAIAAALVLVMSASPVFAQAAAAGQTPARPAPAGQAPIRPVPPRQAPAPTQPATTQPPPVLQPPAPFPQGAKVGFVNLQAVAQLSADGKAANAKVQALAQKKQTEGQTKA